MIVIGKYRGHKVVLKKSSNDTYDLYSIGQVPENFPTKVSTTDPKLVIINTNRMGPKELRDMVKAMGEELVSVNDNWDADMDHVESRISGAFGPAALDVLAD